MSENYVIAIALFSVHCLAEYGPAWRTMPASDALRGHGLRASVFFLLGVAVFGRSLETRAIIALFALTAAREVIRGARSRLTTMKPSSSFNWRLAEVAAHALLLVVWSRHIRLDGIEKTWWWPTFNAEPRLAKLAVAAITWLVVCRLGTILVRSLLHQLGKEPQEQEAVDDRRHYGVGRAIGNLERTLILYLALGGHFGAVGFVLTAKSVARFEDLKDRDFAEYYLLGTLSSSLIALLAAALVRAVWADLL